MYVPVETTDMKLEFFTPADDAGPIMILCPPRIVSVGPNLGVTANDFVPVMQTTVSNRQVTL